MNFKKLMLKDKKGQLASNTVTGIIGLIFLLVIGFVFLAQITGSGLLTANSAEANATTDLKDNLITGVGSIAEKIPTFFVIISAVLIIGFVLILWRQYQTSNLGGGRGGSL